MGEILLWLGVFVFSLAFLIKSSDYFIDYSEKVGLALGFSPVIIGTLILAFGTSLPELITSIIAVLKKAPPGGEDPSTIVIGNVVGSNIANILFVGGAMMIMARKIHIKLKLISVELVVLLISAGLLVFFAYDMQFAGYEIIILLFGFLGYVLYTVFSHKPGEGEGENRGRIKWYYWLILIGGAGGIYIGAEYTVRSIQNLATMIGIGIEIIALSAVAIGTSLPELVVSIVAARKGNMDMAVGNILGSNIFNTFGIIAIPALIGNLNIPREVVLISLPVMVFSTLLLIGLLLTKKLYVWQGFLLLAFYGLYMFELFTGYIQKMLA